MDTLDKTPALLDAEDALDGVFSAEDLALLKRNRSLRQQLVNKLATNDRGDVVVPEDKAEKSMLMTLLGDLDNEIMQRNRLKVAAKVEKGLTDLTGAVAKALLQRRNAQAAAAVQRPTVLPTEIKLENPVPGEMDIGVINLDYTDFIDKPDAA